MVFRAGWICRQVEHRYAFIVTERVGHILPVENMRRSPQRFNAMLGRFVIFAPCHGGLTGFTDTKANAELLLDPTIETHRASMRHWASAQDCSRSAISAEDEGSFPLSPRQAIGHGRELTVPGQGATNVAATTQLEGIGQFRR